MIKNIFGQKKQVQKSKKIKNKTIVCIGGGTGLFSLLSGLKDKVEDRMVLKAVVTTLDNGGSSGRLITQYGVLPPGDIRNCLVALSEQPKIVADLFQYRFDKQLDNHNFGNLLLTALNDITGSFDKAVKEASKILRVKGEVVPVSFDKNNIIANLGSGKLVSGEDAIYYLNKEDIIRSVYLENKNSKANNRAIEVLKNADLIVFGPGGLYNSILPNLLFPEIRNAINSNRKANKVLITGVMSTGNTYDFSVSDFKLEIEKYLKGKLTHVIANNHVPASNTLKEYRKEDKHPIPLDEENVKGCKLIKGNFIDEEKLVRHSPETLSKVIVRLME